MTAPTPPSDAVGVLIRDILRVSRINCTGLGEVGCPKVDGWHSWRDHDAHVAAEIAAGLAPVVAENAALRVVADAASNLFDPDYPGDAMGDLRSAVEDYRAALSSPTPDTDEAPGTAGEGGA